MLDSRNQSRRQSEKRGCGELGADAEVEMRDPKSPGARRVASAVGLGVDRLRNDDRPQCKEAPDTRTKTTASADRRSRQIVATVRVATDASGRRPSRGSANVLSTSSCPAIDPMTAALMRARPYAPPSR